MLDVFGQTINVKLLVLPILYILIGTVVFNLLKGLINRATAKNNIKAIQKQRINTLRTLIINILKYMTVIFVILSILSLYGINVKSILTGLGIGTAIIGLAFQDLAKDIIAGFFIITEGSYEIGDVIEADGFMGEVVFIGLRTTRIRNIKGATKIISNHHMDKLINYSNNNSLAVVDVGIAYECSEEKIEEAFEKLFTEIDGKIPYATKRPEVWGVNDLAASSVVYRVAVETEPAKQFATERYLRKEIKKAFDKADIKIPYQQVEVHNGK